MRRILKSSLIGAVLLTVATPVLAAPDICIDTRQIASQKVEGGGSAIMFTMRDGTQYRNKLQGRCPDLDFNGYVWTVRNPDNTVCDRANTLRVLQSGEVCQIGNFEKVSPARPRPPG